MEYRKNEKFHETEKDKNINSPTRAKSTVSRDAAGNVTVKLNSNI